MLIQGGSTALCQAGVQESSFSLASCTVEKRCFFLLSLSVPRGPSSANAQDCLGCPRPRSHHAALGRGVHHAGRIDCSQTSVWSPPWGFTLDTAFWVSPRPRPHSTSQVETISLPHWLLLFAGSRPLVALATCSLVPNLGAHPSVLFFVTATSHPPGPVHLLIQVSAGCPSA